MDEIKINQQPETKEPPKPLKIPKQRKVWPWFVVLILIILGMAGYIVYTNLHKTKCDTVVDNTQNTADNPTSTDEQTTGTETVNNDVAVKPLNNKVEKIIDEGITWVTPKKLGDLGLFKVNPDFEGMGGYSETNYYLVANTSDGGEIINAFPAGTVLYRFLHKNGKYYKISQNSPVISDKLASSDIEYLTQGFGVDDTTVLNSLKYDNSITQGNTIFVFQYLSMPNPEIGFKDVSKVMNTKWGDMYLQTSRALDNSDDSVEISQYVIRLNDGVEVYYVSKPVFLKDDNTFNVTWENGKQTTNTYIKMNNGGCGNGSNTIPRIVKNSALTDKELVAKYKNSEALYSFSDVKASLNVLGYKFYQSGGASVNLTIQNLVSDMGVIVWRDDLGSNIVYVNSKYSPQLECGKPVIYLYPTTNTAVKVRVGADVTKSEPEYGKGWDVIASPNGKLQIANGVYPYLFWEGIGHGIYPIIKTGTVVSGNQAAATITSQLSSMGLNNKEIADFNEFWQPKLPNTPFVRISWLTTKEMNELAPLSISPKPDSVLRVFLDFQGLNTKEPIAPQILPKLTRKGFTVVEWGGLLRSSK